MEEKIGSPQTIIHVIEGEEGDDENYEDVEEDTPMPDSATCEITEEDIEAANTLVAISKSGTEEKSAPPQKKAKTNNGGAKTTVPAKKSDLKEKTPEEGAVEEKKPAEWDLETLKAVGAHVARVKEQKRLREAKEKEDEDEE